MQRSTTMLAAEKRQSTAKKFDFRSFMKLISTIHPHYWQLGLGLLLGLVATAGQLIVPTIAKSLINALGHAVNMNLVIGVVGLFIGSALISAGSGAVLGFFGEDVVAKLRNKLWAKLLVLPVSYFDTTKSGEITSRLVNDSTQVKDLLANSVPRMVTALMQLIGALILMLMMDWKMTAIMFAVVPLVILIFLPVATQSRKIAFSRQENLAAFSGEAGDVLGAVRLVKSSNAEAVEKKTGDARIDRLYRLGLKEAVYDAVAQPVMTTLMMGMIVGVLAYGASRVASGSMNMGTLFAFLMYLTQLIGPFSTLGQFFAETAKASGSTARIDELLQQPEESRTGRPLKDASGQALTMSHVSFSYDQETPVLKDVTVTAAPNQVIAFAGPSGGGKSTIISLLERFYSPDSGHILIGDQDIANLNVEDWREQIGLVGQDATIMAGTIRYNLTYGATRNYTDEELWHVLDMAYAKTFVEAMSQGLDTEVGERGVKVSGGQRQRLAIARAFLRDPKILMLDEATASLDAESEMMVQKALTKLMHGRTTIVIAHRLSTIMNANRIYFIENGTVSGSGTHEDLIKSHPIYREYVKDQFGKAA
ncbi:multidrug ABC transporter ATPase/permease [Lacticaseibacillus paracasei subsp. paracasei Lpp125]|uniref:ABC transporter ATP-binding protein n=1 Tax=Lacticaseibacillus paracasei TaxID=1597 RepID=UPI0003434183|nr:ABC transporter ATP-binding protein [Lacticaseibacillus paracasei]EPD02303.1 multidrug ABC transporter ATPase/permease [Lacticaseibacillus paracasei subsp. paracasei Lpp125]